MNARRTTANRQNPRTPAAPKPGRRWRAIARPNRRRWLWLFLVAGLPAGGTAGEGTAVDAAKLPPPAKIKADFDRDIKPILEASCLRCHGIESPKARFSLATRESTLNGGRRGVDIVAGQSAQSPLIHYVARLVPNLEMPPKNRGTPLTAEQVGVLRAWIDQGALWSPTNAPTPPQFSFSPTVRGFWVQGNKAQFREHVWAPDGASGGLERFEFKERLPHDRTATVEGRILPNQDDYRVLMTLEQKDLGFTRFGYQEDRKYYSDAGGYYPGFDPSLFTLNRDLHLDTGKAWADVGLTLPDWPRLVFGYEYRFKEGDKSTLQWGPVTDAQGNLMNIHPSVKEVNEAAHVVKFDADYEYRGVRMEDNFRGEFYDLSTSRQNVDTYLLGKAGPDKVVQVKEGENHLQLDNALRFEKQLTPWWLASAGYLYTHLDGNGTFQLDTVLTPYAALAPVTTYGFDKFWQSQQIILNQQANVFNANTMLGPWQGLTLSGGVQAEWMTQRGFGLARVDEGDPTDPSSYFPQPVRLSSNLDRFATDETFGLRYTTIPYTVVFADTRLQQESLGQFEEQSGGFHDFLQNTDVRGDLKDYRAGFTLSPWQRVSLTSHYRRRDKTTDYDHLTDLTRAGGGILPNDGYPAFIRARGTFTDEIETKLAFRPANWIKASVSHQLLTTDYRTDTAAAAGDISPGGSLQAGKYDAHVYSANATITPWRRLYLSSTFSYSDSKTVTAQNGVAAVAPYRGDVYSLIQSANYICTEATDLSASYSFSQADYGQNNVAAGLPLGIVYRWHALQTGVTHRFKKNFTGNLQYAFYKYDEPSSGGFNNYTAHGIFATLTMKWP